MKKQSLWLIAASSPTSFSLSLYTNIIKLHKNDSVSLSRGGMVYQSRNLLQNPVAILNPCTKSIEGKKIPEAASQEFSHLIFTW